MFLEQYWGGPGTYSQERGHPRLRQRHAPFRIGPTERDAWLRHMRRAVDSLGLDPAHEKTLWEYLERAALFMVNTFDEGVGAGLPGSPSVERRDHRVSRRARHRSRVSSPGRAWPACCADRVGGAARPTAADPRRTDRPWRARSTAGRARARTRAFRPGRRPALPAVRQPGARRAALPARAGLVAAAARALRHGHADDPGGAAASGSSSLDFSDCVHSGRSRRSTAMAAQPGRRGNDIVVPTGRELATDARATLVVRYQRHAAHGSDAVRPRRLPRGRRACARPPVARRGPCRSRTAPSPGTRPTTSPPTRRSTTSRSPCRRAGRASPTGS